MRIKKEYSAGGVILQPDENNEAQILLIRIRKDAYELPKGHIEDNETAQMTAVRECIEEVGIENKLTAHQELGSISYSFSCEKHIVEKSVSYFLISSPEAIRYRKPKRTREVRWINQRELHSVNLVNDELIPIIESAFSCRTKI